MHQSVVLPNGTLDLNKIKYSEKLYKGMNGRFVERFYISDSESYIFKPLTNEDQTGKEVWAHENILCHFPAIYPKIISYSISDRAENNWIILEDFGPIQHSFDEEILHGVTKHIAWWHKYPVNQLSMANLRGPKPFIEEMVVSIGEQKDKVLNLFQKLGIQHSAYNQLFNSVSNIFQNVTKVFSHGDLHIGNFGFARGDIVILDWEHVHMNVPYWDLYHLIDSTHPVFPKQVNNRVRESILDEYLNYKNIQSRELIKQFKNEYYVFTIIFSIWMILLIKQNLEQDQTKWSTTQLTRQLNETHEVLRQCFKKI